jgi:hypothetical protein
MHSFPSRHLTTESFLDESELNAMAAEAVAKRQSLNQCQLAAPYM